ncbi:MAG: hypothetical protein WC455_10210 [Dehalococcoidia bacterium]|jgi:hypothetical protein
MDDEEKARKKESRRRWRVNNREKENERNRKWRSDPTNREAVNERKRKAYASLIPEKKRERVDYAREKYHTNFKAKIMANASSIRNHFRSKGLPDPDMYYCRGCKKAVACWSHKLDAFCSKCGSTKLNLIRKGGVNYRSYDMSKVPVSNPLDRSKKNC